MILLLNFKNNVLVFYYNSIFFLGFMVPSSSFIEGMVVDPPSMSVPIKEELGLN